MESLKDVIDQLRQLLKVDTYWYNMLPRLRLQRTVFRCKWWHPKAVLVSAEEKKERVSTQFGQGETCLKHAACCSREKEE